MDKEDDYLNISNPYGGRLNNLQTRLIHQLLGSQFPGRLQAFKIDNYFMQIVRGDVTQDAVWSRKLAQRQEAFVDQKGFSFVINALVGGDFAEAVTAQCQKNLGDDRGRFYFPTTDLAKDLKTFEGRLKRQRPILVGHNQFMDLCFIYRTFFGQMPEKLEEFQREIKSLFPRIIDTKYMVTRGSHDMMPENGLEH